MVVPYFLARAVRVSPLRIVIVWDMGVLPPCPAGHPAPFFRRISSCVSSRVIVRRPMSPPDSKGLAAAFEAARTRYGDFGVPLEAFAAHVAKVARETPIEELQMDDLYLVCASLRRSPQALAVLHRLVWAQEPAIRRMPGIGESTDDLLSEIETRLVLDLEGRPAKLREYAGRGKLASWLRIVVVGTALK